MDRATVIDRAVNFRQRFRNALAVDHNTMIHCPLNEAHNYKKESNRIERYTQILYENHSPICFSLKSFSLADLSIEGGLANATPTCYFFTQFIL